MPGKLVSCITISLIFGGFGCRFGRYLPQTLEVGVSNLSGKLVLSNNNGERIVLSRSGRFKFQKKLWGWASYRVRIEKQPRDRICKLLNYVGSMSEDGVYGVMVKCYGPKFYEVGGSITGLAGTLVLGLYSTSPLVLPAEHLEIKTNGPYRFKTKLPDESLYDLIVIKLTQGQHCILNYPAGFTRFVKGQAVENDNFKCEAGSKEAGNTSLGLEEARRSWAINRCADKKITPGNL